MMKLKWITFSLAALSLVACHNAEEKKVEASEAVEVEEVAKDITYNVPEGSTLNWKGFKTYVDWSHTGTVTISDGTFHTEKGKLVGGEFTMDMNSINPENNVGDEKYPMLVGHLKSPDFFAVEQYPEGRFEITSIEESEDVEKGTTHVVSGNLTIRDQTKNISFPAAIMVSDGSVTFTAPEFGIDRKKWNVHFHDSEDQSIANSLKEDLIDDIILISLEIEGTKTEA